MEWFALAVLSAIIGYPVGKIMDRLFVRRAKPGAVVWSGMSWQLRRRYLVRFWLLVAGGAIWLSCALAMFFTKTSVPDPWNLALGALFAVAALRSMRSARLWWIARKKIPDWPPKDRRPPTA